MRIIFHSEPVARSYGASEFGLNEHVLKGGEKDRMMQKNGISRIGTTLAEAADSSDSGLICQPTVKPPAVRTAWYRLQPLAWVSGVDIGGL